MPALEPSETIRTRIEPSPKWKLVDLKELRDYRDLFYFLVLRDLQVRYKQTVLGGIWAILQPLLTMVVFSLFFGRLGNMPSDGVPYPIFSYVALVPWTYFSNAVTFSSTSLVANEAFISKVYFPRIAIPTAPIFAWLMDFAIASVVLIIMMLAYMIVPTPMILMYPLLTVLMVFTVAGVSLWFAALNVRYRDFRYAVRFVIQLWMFVSPVVYPVSIVPERFRLLYALNPMTGIIEGFRASFLSTIEFPWTLVGVSSITSVIILLTGMAYFRKVERLFADII